MALALPMGASPASASASVPGTPTKKGDAKRKRVRTKEPGAKKKGAGINGDNRDLDSDAELEVSAEDLVAEGDVLEGDGDEEGDAEGEDEDGEVAAGIGSSGPTKRRRRAEEEDEEDEVAAAATAAVGKDIKREAQRRRHEILLFRGALDDEQGRRFDAFHSAVIPKGVIKKVNKDLYDQNIPNNVTSVVAGMVKVFIADVVETALEIQKHTPDSTGPLKPYHLQLARMRLQEQGLIAPPNGHGSLRSSTGLRARKPLFRR